LVKLEEAEPPPFNPKMAITKTGEILGIDVLDHIIVCDKSYSSLKAKNLF